MKHHIPVSHPWVCIDLDGTLMEDGHYPDFGPPIKGAAWACDKLHKQGIKIMVFTARTAMLDLNGKYHDVNAAVENIYVWAHNNGIHIDYVFPMPKPTFVLAFFDDRSITLDNKTNSGWIHAMEEFQKRYPKLKKWQKSVLPPKIERR